MLKQRIFNGIMSPPLKQLGNIIAGPYIPIFVLHRIEDKSGNISGHKLDDLRQALELVRKFKLNPVSLDDAVRACLGELTLPANAIVFSIDDGFWDHAEIAIPLFLEYDCPITCFLITDFLDEKLWPWDDMVSYCFEHCKLQDKQLTLLDSYNFTFTPSKAKQQRDAVRSWFKTIPSEDLDNVVNDLASQLEVELPINAPDVYRPMSWSQARVLEAKGASFGAHSLNHHIFSRMNDAESKRQIVGSKLRLEQELAQPSRVFCYPTGRAEDFTVREELMLKEQGFIGAVATTPGAVVHRQKPNIFALKRYSMPDNTATFMQYCSWLESLR